ncbi:hypothetical protein Cob_v006336 [Colletotrichum orbiculare MAFF 240422]|uniref:Uncharacterized protein n=1 Tax=Colletotrichum orbiculare (strain 104-T / ATCC 96160 / CBS 514.97 / LARS 414 / MAFF 240422) TaxID=1213857 RepID=A0A484FR81_COLOR|nr:hypothetical protein Cob_v006336 [Colletotrichum orbiculare MAFF 240422]
MSRSQATAPMVLRVDVGRTCHQPDDDQMRVRRHPEAREATVNVDIVKIVVSQELVTVFKNNNSEVVITSTASSTPGSRLEPYSALSRPDLAQALQQQNRGGPPASLRSQHHFHASIAFAKAFEDLFKSFYELIASIFSTFYHILQTFFQAIIGFFTGIVNLTADVFSGVIDVVGGVGRFVLGNIVIIGIIAAAGYAYVRYTAQGRQVAAGKKTA